MNTQEKFTEIFNKLELTFNKNSKLTKEKLIIGFTKVIDEKISLYSALEYSDSKSVNTGLKRAIKLEKPSGKYWAKYLLNRYYPEARPTKKETFKDKFYINYTKETILPLIFYFIKGNITNSMIKIDEYIKAIYKRDYRKANITAYYFTKYNKILLPNKPSGKTPINYILNELNLKWCSKCNLIKCFDSFYINRSNIYGLSTICKLCDAEYKKKNSVAYRNNTAKYKCSKLHRTPIWANIEKIKEIYINCPKGYHVDHIIPLQGILVSGLHVENNLQYLSESDNCSKSNKYII